MAEICGILFKNGNDDYELWTDFSLTKEEKETINTILQNHIHEGCSVRGTAKEIGEEMEDM